MEHERKKEVYKVTLAGTVVNMVLVVAKFVAGIVGHSGAMIADAVHSLSDFVTDIIVFVMVGVSSKPQDADHNYGHGKYETLATAVIGLVLIHCLAKVLKRCKSMRTMPIKHRVCRQISIWKP